MDTYTHGLALVAVTVVVVKQRGELQRRSRKGNSNSWPNVTLTQPDPPKVIHWILFYCHFIQINTIIML